MTVDFLMTCLLTIVLLVGYSIGRVDAFQKLPWTFRNRRRMQ